MFRLHCKDTLNYPRVVIEEYTSRGLSFLEVKVNVLSDDRKNFEFWYCILTHVNCVSSRWTSRPLDYVSEDALVAASTYLNQIMRFNVKLAEIGRKRPVYKIMAQISDDQGMPRNWKTDMTFHDARLIGLKNPTRLRWCVRDCGSDIWFGHGTSHAFQYAMKYDKTALFFEINEGAKPVRLIPQRILDSNYYNLEIGGEYHADR